MSQQQYFVPEIQGLRAIAVIIVVLFHAELTLFSGGYVGVDVFFVISGFLITGLMLREYDRYSKIHLMDFFARRIKRLLPVSFFVTIVTLLVFSVVYSAFETKMLTSSAIASLFYMSNIWFASISTDYLQGGADTDPFLHMWSLAVEEQFYLFWPLLFIASYKFVKNGSNFWLMFLAVVCLSFALNLLFIDTHQPWVFFGAPMRAWEFGIGAMCSVAVWRQALKLSHLVSLIGITLGFALLCYAIFFFDQYTLFPGYNALFPVVGVTLILLGVTTGQTTLWSGFLASRSMRFIGDVSYSWYLWHWPAKVFAKEFFTDIEEGAVLASALVSFGLAVLTTRLIENPIRKLSNIKTGQIFQITIIVTAITLAAFGFIRFKAGAAAQLPLQQTFQLAQQDLAQIYDLGCHVNYKNTEAINCEFGSPEAKEVIVLFGDSHAAHWFAAIEHFALENNYRLITHTKSACPSFVLEPFDQDLGRVYSECTDWRENVFDKIDEIKPAFVVLSNYDVYWHSRLLQDRLVENISEAYRQSFRRIAASVVVIKDVGSAPFFVPKCLARFNRDTLANSSDCNFSYQEDPEVTRAEIAVIHEFNEAFYVDLNEVICPDNICTAMTGDRINYIDNHHISDEFSRALAAPLSDELNRLELNIK